MATAASESMPRRSLFRRFGDAVRAGIDFVVRTAKRIGGAIRRFIGWTFNAAKRAGTVIAVQSRRFGTWLGSNIASMGRWIWAQVSKLPHLFGRGLGWALRLGSYLVQAALVAAIVVMLVFAGLGLLAGLAKDNWDENVHERAVNMSEGREFWDKDAAKAQKSDDHTVTVPGEVVASRKTEPIVTPDKTGPVAATEEDVFSWSVEQMNEMTLTGQVTPPEGTPESEVANFWRSLSKHYQDKDRDMASHFFGRSLAARSFLKEPRAQALQHPTAWYIGQETKAIDQRNREAGAQRRPELALNERAVKQGMGAEIDRLKLLYAMKS